MAKQRYRNVGGTRVPIEDDAAFDAAHAPGLDESKTAKRLRVDDATKARLLGGFEYGGHTFSTSEKAQLKIIQTEAGAARGEPLFPLKYSTKDDGVYTFTDANHFFDFVGQYRAAAKAILESGTDLKDEVNQKATAEEVEAVIDARFGGR
jgi:hypothetical protein